MRRIAKLIRDDKKACAHHFRQVPKKNTQSDKDYFGYISELCLPKSTKAKKDRKNNKFATTRKV